MKASTSDLISELLAKGQACPTSSDLNTLKYYGVLLKVLVKSLYTAENAQSGSKYFR